MSAAARIVWQVCASELDASLTEIRLIQALRPRDNVSGAFPFLYPFVGIRVDGRETHFCVTTSLEAFPTFELHGAFRSRAVTREAFFALMRLLRFVGVQAKAQIAKHLDGELTVRPLPAAGRERRAEIRGRAKLNSLLECQEAVCAEVVAGGFRSA